MDLRETYDVIAEQWHEDVVTRSTNRVGLNHLLTVLPKKSTVLDVGCGSGCIAKELLTAGMQVRGVDISENMLVIARRENPLGVFQQKSLHELVTEETFYDVVCAVAVLLHLPRAEFVSALKIISDRCVSHGYIYIVVKEKRADRLEEGIIQEDYVGVQIERYFSFYSLEEVLAACKDIGLEVVLSDVVASGRARWIEVVAQKP